MMTSIEIDYHLNLDKKKGEIVNFNEEYENKIDDESWYYWNLSCFFIILHSWLFSIRIKMAPNSLWNIFCQFNLWRKYAIIMGKVFKNLAYLKLV